MPTSEAMVPDTVQLGWAMGYGYNALGQVTAETYPASVSVTYGVNALGQTTSVSASADGGAATTVASSASYFPNGALKQFTYGNGIVHTLTQNARQLPSRSTDGTVLDLGTSFDANGNVAGVTDYTAAARQTKSMGYDGLDRLTSTTSPMFGTATYAYDTLDNLKQVTVSSGSTPRNHYYCYHATSRRLDFVRSGPVCTGTASPAVTTLGYDVQGNLGNKNGTTYTFDYGNRLRSTAGLTYRYDAQGRRVRQDTAGAQLKYSFYSGDGKLRWQRDEPAAKRLSHIYLGGSLVAELSRPIGAGTAAYTYQHTDALGSPIARTNSARTVIETSEYEPYGKLLNRANDDRPGYTGHVMDAASGLTYMQQRYYDPVIGRFLSVDPVTAYSNGDMRHFNRYAYAANNPYKFKDPDGRIIDTVFDVGFIIADVVDIASNGLNAENGASLAGNIAGALIPGATGLGKVAAAGVVAVKAADKASYLAKAAKSAKFPDAKELSKKLGVDKETFHRGVKDAIKGDHKDAMKTLKTKNPDIGVTKDGNVALKNRETGKVVATETPLQNYKPKDE
ncbi:MAG: RHS repeat-associated core domain-containing protein [Ottowia sp.]|nr:RHS repeat-associated core domain-containing protein [Ottowia sp.]